MNIMEYIKGYRWDTINDANLAMSQLNAFYNLPKPNSVSKFSSDSYFEINGLYYIGYDEMLIPVLGEPTIFDVKF